MNVAALAGPVLAAMAGLVVLLAAVSALAKAVRDRAAARREAGERAFRPTVIALAGGEQAPQAEPAPGTREATGLERAIVGILPLLRGADRGALVRVLEDRGFIERARRATYSRSSLRRARAAETLGVLGTRRALPELGRLLRDRDREVRIVAARALGKLGGAGAVPFLLASLEKPRPLPMSIVTMALIRIGPAGVEEMREGLRSPSPRAREAAAELLGQFGAATALDELIEATSDPGRQVRARSATALGRIGSPRAVPALVELLESDAALEVRVAAVAALGEIGSPGALPAVTAALGAPESDVAWRAARALGQMGAPGQRALSAVVEGAGAGADHAREALGAGAR